MEDARMRALLGLSYARATLRELRLLEARFGPVEEWWGSRGSLPRPCGGLGGRRFETIQSAEWDGRAGEGLRVIERLRVRAGALPAEEAARMPDPPVLWFFLGELPVPDEPCVAMVGARRATAYGLRMASRFARGLGEAGVWVVSGLARGVDGAAHRAAMEGGGRTLAILGCGIDLTYPPEHRALREAIIASGGGILTEHPPGVPALAHHFPRRNRLLAGFCQALVVVEARIRSGTLTSVRWALEHGREVLAVPGPVDSPLSEGPLQLLREGAAPAGSLGDILGALGIEGEGAKEPGAAPGPGAAGLSRSEERLLAWIGSEALDLDDLVRLSGEPPGNLLCILLGLELRGLLVRDPTGLAWQRRE